MHAAWLALVFALVEPQGPAARGSGGFPILLLRESGTGEPGARAGSPQDLALAKPSALSSKEASPPAKRVRIPTPPPRPPSEETRSAPAVSSPHPLPPPDPPQRRLAEPRPEPPDPAPRPPPEASPPSEESPPPATAPSTPEPIETAEPSGRDAEAEENPVASAPTGEPGTSGGSLASVASAPPPGAHPPGSPGPPGSAGATDGSAAERLRDYVDRVREIVERNQRYPSLARRRGIEGLVRVRLVVTAEGGIELVDLEKDDADAPHPLLARSAVEAVERAGAYPPPPQGRLAIVLPIRWRLHDEGR